MPARVTETNHISINGNLFRTRGKVREFLASQPPGKLTLGDYSDASNPFSSEWSFDDGRGGIGVEVSDPRTDLDRIWYGTVQLRFKGRIVLPRLAILTAAGPTDAVGIIKEFKNKEYASFGKSMRLYNNSTDSWGSNLRTLLNAATDAKKGILYPSATPTETLVIATGSEVDYWDNSTWARNTTDIKFLVFWHNLLWGMNNAGQLYYTDDLSKTWSVDALLQLPAGHATALFMGRGADSEFHIYVSTKVGLFIHDSVNLIFKPTDLSDEPYHEQGGEGSTRWRGSIFYPAGTSIQRFQPGPEGTPITTMGPDRDHGLPERKRGVIRQMFGSKNDLLILMDASQAAGLSGIKTRVSRGVGNHHGATFSAQTGFGLILGWNEDGYEVKWESSESAAQLTIGDVSNAYSTNRLWWVSNQRVYYMALPIDVVNPLQVPTTAYGPSGTLETSWLDFRQRNTLKLALSYLLETINPTSDETVKVEYALNYVESYTEIVTQTTTGESETTFPIAGDNPIGITFRAIKFRVTMARGSTNTNTPQLIKMTLVWRQRNKDLIGISADIVLSDRDDKPGRQTLTELKTALFKNELAEVTYRNDESNEQNYYGELIDLQTITETGEDHDGLVRITFAEPRQTTARNA